MDRSGGPLDYDRAYALCEKLNEEEQTKESPKQRVADKWEPTTNS